MCMKGFMTKRDIRHFWKAEIKSKKLHIFTSFPLITSDVYILNVSNEAKVVGGSD